MKYSLLLLTLTPFCLSADPEVKETVDSVTYQKGWLLKRNVTIEKKEDPTSETYSHIVSNSKLEILGYTLASLKRTKGYVRYKKNKNTKKISASVNIYRPITYYYDNRNSLVDESTNLSIKNNEKGFKLLKALFVLKKHEAFVKENKNV